jgi:fumarylpyruvate hydrolase
MSAPRYVISAPAQPAIAIAGSSELFPVRHIWCVGRNYEEHIREMGHDVRDPPFFFSKRPTPSCPTGRACPTRP